MYFGLNNCQPGAFQTGVSVKYKIKGSMSINICFYIPKSVWSVKSELLVYIDGLMQERRNSIANALELRLLNPSICVLHDVWMVDEKYCTLLPSQ